LVAFILIVYDHTVTESCRCLYFFVRRFNNSAGARVSLLRLMSQGLSIPVEVWVSETGSRRRQSLRIK
jgi:hypothetical protein